MGKKTYYVNEEEGMAAVIEDLGSSFTVRFYAVSDIPEESFETPAEAEEYVKEFNGNPYGWKECDKEGCHRMLKAIAEEEDSILEEMLPGITIDEDFDDFPSYMND